MKRKNQNKYYCVRVSTLIINCVCEYLSNISPNHTSQTYVNNQSISCIKLLFN